MNKRIAEGARVRYLGRTTSVLLADEEGEVISSTVESAYVKLDRDETVIELIPTFYLEKIADPVPVPFGSNPLKTW